MTLQLIHLNFLIYEENFVFFFKGAQPAESSLAKVTEQCKPRKNQRLGFLLQQ
jgi:hypothetical protein